MNTFSSLKEKWNSETPKFKNKVSKVLNSANTNSGVMVNPFIKKNGSLVNPYLNYQRLLDSPNISAKAKSFIQSATGLIPTSEEISLKNNRTEVPTFRGRPPSGWLRTPVTSQVCRAEII